MSDALCSRMIPSVTLPHGHPTLLRHPVPDGIPFPVETVLNLPAAEYQVEQHGDWWIVRVVVTGEAVYQGPGPVEVFVSEVLF
jgi:hypothetical protein